MGWPSKLAKFVVPVTAMGLIIVGSPYWVWLALVAFVWLVLIVFLWWFHRRAMRPVAGPDLRSTV